MIALSLAQIAEIVGGELSDIGVHEAARTLVTGTVEFDSRAVTPGGLFLALPGANSDGHDFARSAVAAGAVAVLAARPVGVPAIVVTPVVGDCTASVLSHDRDGSGSAVLAALGLLAAEVAARLVADGLTIVGVTGSSGKTSTKDLLAAVLSPLGQVIAPPESFNNELGYPWTVLRATTDTDYLILEMSARHRGNIAALAAIAPPKIGLVLNVGVAHLGEFGSRQAIADTKAELPQAVPENGVVVLNIDDSTVAAMAEKTRARVVRVSRAGPADVWTDSVALDDLARARFTLNYRGGNQGTAESTMRPRDEAEEEGGNQGTAESTMRPRDEAEEERGNQGTEVQLAVHGDHQVANALCAAAVALECGATGEQVAAALAAAGPVSAHRMAVVNRADGVTVINDAYNANPDSMRAGLQALAWMARQSSARRSFAVLGEMAELGEDTISEHDRIGRLAVRLDVSRLIVVGSGRAMSAMHQGAVLEGSWGAEVTRVADADAALVLLRDELRPGDVVLVKASKSTGLAKLAQTVMTDTDPDGDTDQ